MVVEDNRLAIQWGETAGWWYSPVTGNSPPEAPWSFGQAGCSLWLVPLIAWCVLPFFVWKPAIGGVSNAFVTQIRQTAKVDSSLNLKNHFIASKSKRIKQHTWAARFCAARFEVDSSRLPPPFFPSLLSSPPLSPALALIIPVPAMAGSMLWSCGPCGLVGPGAWRFSILWVAWGFCTWASRCSRRADKRQVSAPYRTWWYDSGLITHIGLRHSPVPESQRARTSICYDRSLPELTALDVVLELAASRGNRTKPVNSSPSRYLKLEHFDLLSRMSSRKSRLYSAQGKDRLWRERSVRRVRKLLNLIKRSERSIWYSHKSRAE